ncbi:amidohydrolase, putative [Heliomicrobium modesticaldum Ice1]|uniref:5-methylthioadenosine/S-adenosylhomocysteine deaminase n=1 Tax=Heliobacterium modesticaldum (strain ATCC 51547 / Ice1) TaxID=498761 RepID=B0TBU5_HELMI|nr:5'-deoxyadenosine deaminase [Heliomicrobium modesticaldum]ABZ85218.1 amidohydrolase, putative [Heliomicrobium modesticaldum Ice1]
MSRRIIIKDALIVTMNQQRQVIRGDLAICDGVISSIRPGGDLDSVGESSPASDRQTAFFADRIIDAQGRMVIPGIIQGHIHLCQTLFRGQADDLELLDWLKLRIWPLEGAHDAESLYTSACLGIGEMFRCGTTAIVDMATVHHTESVFQAIVDSGIRALSGKCMMDRGQDVPVTLMEQREESLRESVDLLEKWHGKGDGRLHYAFAPRFAISCSEELLLEVGDLARRYGVMIHTHASESRGEIAIVQEERKMRNVLYFDHLGMAGDNLILAHCIWLDEAELDLIEQRRIKVSHCPSCNLKLGSGVAPIPELIRRNVAVSIGADGAPCNNNLDPFTEMRTAALIQKALHGPTAMPAWQVFELATLGGAQVMGMADRIGSLEVGKRADLAMLDLNHLHCAPIEGADVYTQLVYQARGSDVVLTMVDGRIVYEEGKLTTIDEKDLLRDASEAIVRVVRRAGIVR